MPARSARRIVAFGLALLLASAPNVRASDAPTATIIDINPGSDGSYALDYSTAVALDGWLYFAADDGVHGYELWRTNVATGASEMVKDIFDGVDDSFPNDFMVYDGKVYFGAYDGVSGRELWRTDGTSGGTSLAVDLNTSGSSLPEPIGVYNDLLYVSADDGVHGRELFGIDGATLSVTLHDVVTGAEGSNPAFAAVYSDHLYFVAGPATTPEARVIWRTDGTDDEALPTHGDGDWPSDFLVWGPTAGSEFLWFTQRNGAPSSFPGRELYYTDGALSVALASDVWSGADDGDPHYTLGFKGKLWFAANDEHGFELWTKTFLGAAQRVSDIHPSGSGDPLYLTPLGDWLYFSATDGTGYELWRSNGVDVEQVADINPGGGSGPNSLIAVGHWLYFTAYDPAHGRELWRSDGETTERVAFTVPDVHVECDCYDTSLIAVEGRLFFTINQGDYGNEIAYLDEPTYGLPATNTAGGGGSLSTLTLVALSLVTLVAGAMLQTSRRRTAL